MLSKPGPIMPKNTLCFFLIQIFSTLSFAVLYSTLVLYTTNSLGKSEQFANNLTGIFLSLHFSVNLLSGLLGGRFISYRNLFLVGIFLECIGIVTISNPTVFSLFMGLSIFVSGSGLYVTSLNCILTQQFDKNNNKSREHAFYWSYSGMNIGFLLGYSLSGWFSHTNHYSTLFLSASLSSFIAMLIFVLNWSKMHDKDTQILTLPKTKQKIRTGLCIFFILCLIPVVLNMMQHSHISNEFILLLGISMLVLLFSIALKQKNTESKRKIFAFVSLLFAACIFWSLYYIGPMGITLFMKTHVNRNIDGFIIPVQWFNNINTLIIISGPFLAKYFNHLRENGLKLSIPAQFSIGILFMGLAYFVLIIGVQSASSSMNINPSWMALYFIIQSIGELFISPIGYAMVGALAPTKVQGIMMGSWMMVSGVSSSIAHYLSNFMVTPTTFGSDNINSYVHYFSILGSSALICSLVLFLFIPKINRLMGIEKKIINKGVKLELS